ncbi:MAG: hypothetical protein WCS42_19615 [Verrucomicrobiota bacterium]
MNEAQAREMAKTNTPPPWSEPCMVFCEGRYYLQMFFMSIPR